MSNLLAEACWIGFEFRIQLRSSAADKRTKFEFRPQLRHDNQDLPQRLSYSSWRRHQ
jgi:hypothetical protein